MRRYFKRTIAVLAIALMCSTLIGGGVLAENESENDFNDGVNVEETGGNEDVPEIYSEGKPGTVSGETEGKELETNVEEARSALAGAVSPQSNDCPVELTLKSKPTSGYESFPSQVDLGDKIEYYVQVKNVHDKDDLTNVEVKIHVDDSLEADVATAKYNLTATPSVSNQHPISGSSDYSVRLEGNDVVFKANQLSLSNLVMFHITCSTKSEGTVSSKASVCSVGGVSYSGIESSSTYHNVRQEVSDFTLSTQLQSNNRWVDENHVFYYNINLSKNGKGVNMSLPYQIVKEDTVKSEGVLEFENGIGAISLPTGCAMKSSKMPTGLSYIITHRPDSNFTWEKDTIEGITDLSGTTKQFNVGQIYNPLKYSLDTDIIVKMDGRNFKAGDSFTYAIVAENEEENPPFNRFYLPSGDNDTIAYYEGYARIKPSSGKTATLSLKENIQAHSCYVTSCGKVYRTGKEYSYCELGMCGAHSYGLQNKNVNIAPEIIFAHPGTYNYIVFQTAMESSDYDSIQKDQTQYKVTVTVTANGSNLTPSLTSVNRSIDGGKTWINEPDKSKLTFTNTLKIEGVVKGDIDKSGKIDIKDVMLCLNHVAQTPNGKLQGEAFASADINGDNKVDIKDVMRILNYVSGARETL